MFLSFYGTSTKDYYILSLNGEYKIAKDIYRNVFKMNTFKITLHNVFTELKNKVALYQKDDKSYLRYNTRILLWGHSDIILNQTDSESSVQAIDYVY